MKKKTRYVILGLLRDEELTGYELKSQIDLRMSFFWKESYGQLYPELNTMVKEGLLLGREENEENNRGKIRYSITESGRDVFNQWMSEDFEKDTVRSEALLKFFLADDSNKLDLIKHLEKFYHQNHETLELYQKFHQSLMPYKEFHNHSYILQMLDLGIKQQSLYCEWSQNYIGELKKENYDLRSKASRINSRTLND